jgi:hypothetical protein
MSQSAITHSTLQFGNLRGGIRSPVGGDRRVRHGAARALSGARGPRHSQSPRPNRRGGSPLAVLRNPRGFGVGFPRNRIWVRFIERKLEETVRECLQAQNRQRAFAREQVKLSREAIDYSRKLLQRVDDRLAKDAQDDRHVSKHDCASSRPG